MSKLFRTMSFTILAVMLAATVSHFALAAKPGGGGGTQPAEFIYYPSTDDSRNPACMTMLPDGSNKTPTTCGEPSHLLHGGMRWFVTTQSIPGEFYPIHVSRPVLYGNIKPLESDVAVVDYVGDPTPDLAWVSNFFLQIDGEGSPDTFRWTTSWSPGESGVAITGDVQELDVFGDGTVVLSIQFASTTGHIIDQSWKFRVSKRGRLELFAVAGNGQAVQLTDDPTLQVTDPTIQVIFRGGPRWIPGDAGVSWIGQRWFVTHTMDGVDYGDVIECGIYGVQFTDPLAGPYLPVQLFDEAVSEFPGSATHLAIQDHSWAPQADRLVFSVSDPEFASNNSVVVVGFNPPFVAEIVVDQNFAYETIDWSPTGEWIAFRRYPAGRDQGGGIARIRPDGSGLKLILSDAIRPTSTGSSSQPKWSPDGTRLTYSWNTWDHKTWASTSDVFRATWDGKSRTNLTNTGRAPGPTAWRKN